MDVIQMVGIGVVAAILILLFKEQRPELAIQLSIVAGIAILLPALGRLMAVIELLKKFADRADLDIAYIAIVLKTIGIAYVAEFGADICRDAGAQSIASKIELGAKIAIAAIAVPLVTSLFDLILRVMP